MRPITQVLGAAGFSDWVPVDRNADTFNIGFAVVLGTGAAGTYSVQHSFDDLTDKSQVSLSRSTTTATLTKIDHRSRVGDSVIVEGAGAPFDGTFAVASVVDANNITYTVPNSGLTAARGFAAILRVLNHDSVVTETTTQQGTYSYPVSAIRFNVTAYTSGEFIMTSVQAGK